MSDINDIVKKLTVVPSSVGTTVNTKASANASYLDYVYKYIQLAGYNGGWMDALPNNPSNRNRRLLFQYNFTFDSAFYILNFDEIKNDLATYVNGGTLCVKYRIGTAVMRYVLAGSNQNLGADYSNQLIGANCCFEFWSLDETVVNRGILIPINFKTSLFNLPQIIGQSSDVKVANNIKSLNDTLGVNLPEALPYNQVDIVWNSN